jgi:hypothetical protein
LAGAKKTLKTSILIALAVSLVIQRPFLGKQNVLRKARVLIMSGESGMGTLQETARRIAESMGLAFGDLEDDLLWSDELPRFDHLADLEGLDLLLKKRNVEVLVVDPAYLCMDGEGAENLFKQGTTLRAFNDVCHNNNVTLIIAHHLKRGVANPLSPPELEDIAWAGFQEWARQWLLIGRRERYEPGTGQHRLWLNIGGSAGHSALWALNIDEGALPNRRKWEVTVLHADEARTAVEERREEAKDAKAIEKIQQDKEKLIRAMSQYPNGETEKVIKDTAGVSGSRAKLAFAELLRDGDAVPIDITKTNRKAPYQGYKLADRKDVNTP